MNRVVEYRMDQGEFFQVLVAGLKAKDMVEKEVVVADVTFTIPPDQEQAFLDLGL